MCKAQTKLVWTPVYKVLEEQIKSGDDIILIIVPFAKLSALQQLHWVQANKSRVKVVCRWQPRDLLSGSSDLEVFTYLRAHGCELYINPDIHLKLYIFASNMAFSTSGNLTLRGLGYSDDANVEIGNIVGLCDEDWVRIYRIIATSRQVDDVLYERFKQFLNHQTMSVPSPMAPDLLGPAKLYTIASLPATETPSKLAAFYLKRTEAPYSPEEIRRAVHDLVVFQIPENIPANDFDLRLGEAFRKIPFVIDFVDLLRRERSLRFGAVNEWIHQKCEDVPLPYRWEIKENTHIFYDWLAHFYPDITWDRPNYSQVIHWGQK